MNDFVFISNPDTNEQNAVPVKNNGQYFIEKPKTVHDLKIFKRFYIDVHLGKKKCEIRKNDRGYREGDLIQFTIINNDYEIIEQAVTKYIITHVLNFEQGLNDGYVALSIEKYKGK
ncbi:DUF3850 domain-containing protein [Acholeplasma hippikon]|uniref:Domain of Uncharacterized Function with PDB structure n=1 Tax=Acholeplasma hippikon TaxID=264636 RepID=A0A449BJY0_9MOLU|nr:DUF3850 domain-containing protein [Acholeplasma hippikon]VEU82754.1 Domain of Uncharacterised Function with PDB structure [Acholeplasma hippikon]